MKTVIVGRSSNLSTGLAAAIPDTLLLSARELEGRDIRRVLPDGPFRLVMNQFQPARRLNDMTSPTSYVQLALSTTAQLLEALVGLECRKVLYTSSAAVYGDNAACEEADRLEGTTLHAALKASNEYLVRNFCLENQIDHTIVRLFNLYGGDDEFSVVTRIIRAARDSRPLVLTNSGNAIRDFIHIDDVVHCYRTLLRCVGPCTVNVATGRGTSVRSIVEAVRSRGYQLPTSSMPAREISVSTANVSRLARVVEVERFVRVAEYVLAELRRGA